MKKKRLSFNAIKELMFLKKQGAQLFSNIDVELLSGFTRIAGSRLTDMWIRNEIHNFINFRYVDSRLNIFLTGDLMNA